MNRLLTALACAVLAVLCATGTGMAEEIGNRGGSYTSNFTLAGKTVMAGGTALFTASENGTVDSIGILLFHLTTDPHDMMMAVYDASYNLVDTTAVFTTTTNSTAYWEVKPTLLNGSITSGQAYYVVGWSETGSGTPSMRYASDGAEHMRYKTVTWGTGWPDPISSPSLFDNRVGVAFFITSPAAAAGAAGQVIMIGGD